MYNEVKRLSDQIEMIGRRISELSANQDNESMRELIAARRELAEQLPLLVAVATSSLNNLERESASPLRADLTRLASAFRHELASLQSEWPSVAIRSNPSGYAKQKKKLGAAEQAFFGWLVECLLPALK
jgi:transcriptional regulator with XRE-family HTH domain